VYYVRDDGVEFDDSATGYLTLPEHR